MLRLVLVAIAVLVLMLALPPVPIRGQVPPAPPSDPTLLPGGTAYPLAPVPQPPVDAGTNVPDAIPTPIGPVPSYQPVPNSTSAVPPQPGTTYPPPVPIPVPRRAGTPTMNGLVEVPTEAPGPAYWAPGGYEVRIGSPYYYNDPAGGQYSMTGNPYYDHFGPGFHRHSLHGHYRFPYYNYRAPWYYPGRAVYNRDTNFVW